MPKNPSIFHITHLENLASIIRENRLWSDSERIRRALPNVGIGYTHIKQRRIERPLAASARGHVGDYVPFYFCPRSPMLYVIYRGNQDDLQYRGGQTPIVHLVTTVNAAVATGRPWAFTDGHADLVYRSTKCYEDLKEFRKIDWAAVAARDWRSDEVKEKKQAEFLVRDWFPWSGIELVGVINEATAAKVRSVVGSPTPAVEVHGDWYY